MSKIYVICNKHDENLLSLYQEARLLGHTVIPFYHSKYDESFRVLYNDVTSDDYIMILHTSFGSQVIPQVINNLKYKRFLNEIPLKHPLIPSKFYQQHTVALLLDSSLTIPTYFSQEEITSYPYIAKPIDGSCGQGIVLVKSNERITNPPSNYIFQPYVPNDGDWRVVVVGNKAISAIKRLGKVGQPTNNIATGNFAVAETDSKVLDEIYPIAEKVSRLFGFDYVGIDIIKDIVTNKYYFLETNERPTFETSQILTGVNISQKIIQELTKDVR